MNINKLINWAEDLGEGVDMTQENISWAPLFPVFDTLLSKSIPPAKAARMIMDHEEMEEDVVCLTDLQREVAESKLITALTNYKHRSK